MLGLAGEHACEIGAEISRDDVGGIVRARLDALYGLVFGHELPTQLIIVLQVRFHLGSDVDMPERLDIGADIGIRHRHPDVPGVPVRIPIRPDAVPRIERRENDKSCYDDERNRIARKTPQVAREYPKGGLHGRGGSSSFGAYDAVSRILPPTRPFGKACKPRSRSIPNGGSISDNFPSGLSLSDRNVRMSSICRKIGALRKNGGVSGSTARISELSGEFTSYAIALARIYAFSVPLYAA